MRHFVGIALLISAGVGLVGGAFSYDAQLSGAFYTLAGFGLYIFGIWGAILLLNKK